MRAQIAIVGSLLALHLWGCSAQSSDPATSSGAGSGGATSVAGHTGNAAGAFGGAGASSIGGGAAGSSPLMQGSGIPGQDGGNSGTSSSAGGSAQAGTGGSTGSTGNSASAGAAGASAEVGGAGGMAGTGGAAAFDPCPKSGPCAVMPLGDSITEGYRSSDYGGYRKPLFVLALQAKQSITFVGSAPPRGPTTVNGVTFPRANEGVGGRRIADISALIPTTLDTNRPDIILLHIGTNDLTEGVSSMTSQLGALIDKILQARPSALLVVAQIIPSRSAASNTTIEAYDAAIPALVQARAKAGKHIALVDMHGVFIANASYKTALLYDDYHPRDVGYSILGDNWYSAIRSYLR